MSDTKRIILAVTGASGAIYAVALLELLQRLGVEVHGIISNAGRKVMAIEEGRSLESLMPLAHAWYEVDDFTAPVASGSARFEAMVVLPCSMGTLAAIAHGFSGNLIHRAADVTLKERRPLLLAVRETPFNRTHLVNMLEAHDAGATIIPPLPAFYHRPGTVQELVGNYCGRLAEQLGFEVADLPRWGE
ncbi:MAG TPA: UbiX family flavin prenyltransferase [Desulfurivibrionaceae bacterium]|nr:UbiX family flavin prenyltransferase [Desulfurivibrionaceae bacterium]